MNHSKNLCPCLTCHLTLKLPITLSYFFFLLASCSMYFPIAACRGAEETSAAKLWQSLASCSCMLLAKGLRMARLFAALAVAGTASKRFSSEANSTSKAASSSPTAMEIENETKITRV